MSVSAIPQESPDSTVRAPAAVKSKARQWQELIQLKARTGLTRSEYYLYGFHQRDKDYAYMLNFLTLNTTRSKLRPVLNDPKWKIVLDNKWLFHRHCSQFDLPVPEVYGLYDPGGGFTRTGQPLGTAKDLAAFLHEHCPSTLVIKPVGGLMGKQVLILQEIRYTDGTIEAVTNTGQSVTFEELAEMLDRPPNVKYYTAGYELDLTGYLLEARVQQHPFLNELAPWTTNTVRVVTFLDQNEEAHVHSAIFRIGRQGSMTDNWEQGGICVAVDLASGGLGAGVLKYSGHWLEVHPDTGVRFTGGQLPYWEETLALCRRAARLLPKVRSIGWDVAITPAGPVLIEGNPDWGVRLVQVHMGGYLQPAIREQLAPFGLTFPEGTLPPVSLRDWWMWLQDKYRDRAFYRRSN